MTIVENVVETGTNVVLDGKYFVNCKYTACNLTFCGGDVGWIDTEFKDCKIRFEGPAQRTENLMRLFDLLAKKPNSALQLQPPSKPGDT